MMPVSRVAPWLLSAVCALAIGACGRSPQQKALAFLAQGDRFLQSKDFNRAILAYRNAADLAPKDPEPVYRLGKAYEKIDNLAGAVAAYREAIHRKPDHQGAQVALASLMVFSQHEDVLQEAEKRLYALAGTNQPNAEATDALAVAEWKLGKPGDATRLLESALRNFPADLQTAVVLAEVKARQHDETGAEKILRDAASRMPDSPDAALALGRFLVQEGKPDPAGQELRRALQLRPQYAPALFSLGLMEMKRGHEVEAEQFFSRLAHASDRSYQGLYGLFLLQQHRTDAALTEFKRLYEADRTDRVARSRLVAAYLMTNRPGEAEQTLAAALKLNPRDADALLERSELAIRAGNLGSAENDLDTVLRLQPDSPAARSALAKVRRLQGRVDAERQELSETLSHHPDYLPARVALARNFLLANEAKSALAVIDGATEGQKNSLDVLIERNWALIALGRKAEARQGVDRALAISRNPDALEQDGYLQITGGSYAVSRADAEEILSQNPENMRAVRLLIDSYRGENRLEAGMERVRSIVARNDRSAPLKTALGQILLAAGKRDEARSAFEGALLAAPKFTAAQLSLVQMDLAEQRPEAARPRLEAVLAREPANLDALWLSGELAAAGRDWHTAAARYQSVVELSPRNAAALVKLTSALLAEHQTDAALPFAERAVEAAPDSAEAQETLGRAYFHKGKYERAVQCLKLAMEKQSSPERQYHLALAYFKTGQTSLARSALVTALKKDPELETKNAEW